MDHFCTGNKLFFHRNGKASNQSHLCQTEFYIFEFTPVRNTFHNEHLELPCKPKAFNQEKKLCFKCQLKIIKWSKEGQDEILNTVGSESGQSSNHLEAILKIQALRTRSRLLEREFQDWGHSMCVYEIRALSPSPQVMWAISQARNHAVLVMEGVLLWLSVEFGLISNIIIHSLSNLSTNHKLWGSTYFQLYTICMIFSSSKIL